MNLADGIQIAIAAIGAAASGAAWQAALAARDSARETRKARQFELHNQRLATLQDMIGLVAGLSAGVHPIRPADTYAQGARLRSLVISAGRSLPICQQIGEEMRGLKIEADLIPKADAELRNAIGAENGAMAQLEAKPKRLKRR
jgi:hypothetical protein